MVSAEQSVPFSSLAAADLRVETFYLQGSADTAADDALAQLLQVGNQVDFRRRPPKSRLPTGSYRQDNCSCPRLIALDRLEFVTRRLDPVFPRRVGARSGALRLPGAAKQHFLRVR